MEWCKEAGQGRILQGLGYKIQESFEKETPRKMHYFLILVLRRLYFYLSLYVYRFFFHIGHFIYIYCYRLIFGIIGYYYFVSELLGIIPLFTVACCYFTNFTIYFIVKGIFKWNKYINKKLLAIFNLQYVQLLNILECQLQ